MRPASGEDHGLAEGLTRADHVLEALVGDKARGPEHEVPRQEVEETTLVVGDLGAPVVDGLDELDVDRRVDDAGLDTPGAADAVADEVAVRREVCALAGSVTGQRTQCPRCDAREEAVAAGVVGAGPHVAGRSVDVYEAPEVGRCTPELRVVGEGVGADKRPLVPLVLQGAPGDGHERQGERLAPAERRARHPRLVDASGVEASRRVVPQTVDVGVGERGAHRLQHVLRSPGLGDPLVDEHAPRPRWPRLLGQPCSCVLDLESCGHLGPPPLRELPSLPVQPPITDRTVLPRRRSYMAEGVPSSST